MSSRIDVSKRAMMFSYAEELVLEPPYGRSPIATSACENYQLRQTRP